MDSFAWASVSQAAGLAGGGAVSDGRGGGFLPPMLGFQQLPPTADGLELFMDSGLVQRPARSSCFAAGDGAPTASPSYITSSEEPSGHRSKTTAGNGDAEPGFGGGPVYDAAPRGDCSSMAMGPEPHSKKRRSNEDVHGTDQDQGMASNASADCSNECGDDAKGEEEPPAMAAAAAAGKKKEKGAKAADEPYIHIRARKGQATNRHSLAERLRREKISERMKLLQDLVPGCSKATGKAVMLDEIINYVQSLQRQVEFLSMKLATVNPQLGLDIKGLLSKDQHIRFPGAPPSTHIEFSFSHEMMPKLPPLSQSSMLQGGVRGAAISNGFRTVIEEQLNGKDSVGERLSQMPLTLAGSFHNAAQTAYGAIGGSEHLSMRPGQDRFHM